MKMTKLSSLISLSTSQTLNAMDVIIGGDCNLVLDTEKDKKGGLAKTHQNSVKNIQEFSEKLDLVDVWRVLHPETSRYTWRQRHPKVRCPLDFFLISQSAVNITSLADIVPGYKTDHSMITLKGHSHAILVHFENKKNMSSHQWTPTNNGLVLLPKTILLHGN